MMRINFFAIPYNRTTYLIFSKGETAVYLGKPLQNTLVQVRSADNSVLTEGTGQLFVGK